MIIVKNGNAKSKPGYDLKEELDRLKENQQEILKLLQNLQSLQSSRTPLATQTTTNPCNSSSKTRDSNATGTFYNPYYASKVSSLTSNVSTNPNEQSFLYGINSSGYMTTSIASSSPSNTAGYSPVVPGMTMWYGSYSSSKQI